MGWTCSFEREDKCTESYSDAKLSAKTIAWTTEKGLAE